jgi:hypothetical protein
MGLRILTGVLVPEPGKEGNGQAVIQFNPHGVFGDANGQDLREWGDTGDFDAPPSAVVSLKHIEVSPPSPLERFRVTEGPPTAAQMEVEWETSPIPERIMAISYMIVGEA